MSELTYQNLYVSQEDIDKVKNDKNCNTVELKVSYLFALTKEKTKSFCSGAFIFVGGQYDKNLVNSEMSLEDNWVIQAKNLKRITNE